MLIARKLIQTITQPQRLQVFKELSALIYEWLFRRHSLRINKAQGRSIIAYLGMYLYYLLPQNK